MKDVQATERAFKREHQALQNMNFSNFFTSFCFCGHDPCGSGSSRPKSMWPCGSGFGSISTTLVIWLLQYVAGSVKSVLKTKQDFPNEKS